MYYKDWQLYPGSNGILFNVLSYHNIKSIDYIGKYSIKIYTVYYYICGIDRKSIKLSN